MFTIYQDFTTSMVPITLRLGDNGNSSSETDSTGVSWTNDQFIAFYYFNTQYMLKHFNYSSKPWISSKFIFHIKFEDWWGDFTFFANGNSSWIFGSACNLLNVNT